MHIAVLSKSAVSVASLERALAPWLPLTVCGTREALLDAIADVDVLVVQNKGFGFRVVDEDVLARAPRLALIQHHGVMHDATDAAAARARGITLAVTTGGNHVSVAELAFHLLLACLKRAHDLRSAVAARRIGQVLASEAHGRTLCLVGTGRIGRALARMARGFSMRVIGVRRSGGMTDELAAAGFAAVFPVGRLADALAQAHAVILAIPLDDSTIGLMNETAFAALAPGSTLINVSRGANVDRAALDRALASGRLAAFGSDVWWQEPADPADPLLADPRVHVTPHAGAETQEAVDRMSMAVRANLDRHARGEPLENVIRG